MANFEEREILGKPVPLLESVKQAATLLSPIAEAASSYTWTGDDDEQAWELYKRSIIKRQFEALNTIIHLVENDQGHFGVTLLRPAYEELLWGEYLEKKQKILAPRIALLLTRRELNDAIMAQNQFMGAKAMQLQGFTQKNIKRFQATVRPDLAELRAIGKKLGWRNDEPPGAAALARMTGRENEYNFIYHATSKYVHFSTWELSRRAWGQRGKFTIGSSQFSNYWSDFSLY